LSQPRRCPYCHRSFLPSSYRPQQSVCSRPECQRQRRSDHHRKKLATDPEYFQVVLDSQKQWWDEHPDYQKQHRQPNPEASREQPSGPTTAGSEASGRTSCQEQLSFRANTDFAVTWPFAGGPRAVLLTRTKEEFYPIGLIMLSGGEIRHVGAKIEGDNHPPSQSLVDLLIA